MKKIIYLQRIGELDQSIMLKLKKNLAWEFRNLVKSVKVLPDHIQLSNDSYNSIRKQHDGSLIMEGLIRNVVNNKYFRILGVVGEDIYSRMLNFVFGIAKKPKIRYLNFPSVAIISIARLKESFYRRPENKSLEELRILKEAIHELGHTFSLSHCKNHCIMIFSKNLRDTDNKPPKFCESCSKELRNAFNNLE